MGDEWHPLGDVLYRKWAVYDMQLPQFAKDIDNFVICGAQYGGPLAMIRDERKLIPAEKGANAFPWSPRLWIYSSSGVLLAEVPFLYKQVVAMGWSDQEHLLIALEDGRILGFDIHGKQVAGFNIFGDETELTISEAHFWGNGVAVLGSDLFLHVVEGLAHLDASFVPRAYKMLTGLTRDRHATAIAIVPPVLSRASCLEVLIATSDNSVLIVDQTNSEDQQLQERITSPIVKMSVAPNGRFLACFTRDGILTVMSTAFTTKVLDFDTKSASKPLQIVWCGEDAVVMHWKNTGVVMVGPYGDWLNFPQDGPLYLAAEPDCCRVITGDTCDIIQRVPAAADAIRRIGSTDPAALLYDAMEAFEEGDPKADENIRSIESTNQLADAVQSCIAAAVAEFDVTRQASLLKAAAYGKAFCPNLEPSEFVDAGKNLRVLNTVRSPEVGLPLTIQQYNRLTPEVLVSRLVMRNHHFLALKICSYLKLSKKKVLVHWASEKIRRASNAEISDEQLCALIRKRLEGHDEVSYLEIARTANQMNRKRLATLLLDLEPHANDQVPLLLAMHEEEAALAKAIKSGDTDLIYLVLIHMINIGQAQHSDRAADEMLERLYRMIHAHPEAVNLLKVYYMNKTSPADRQAFQKLMVLNRSFLEAGLGVITQAYLPGTTRDRYKELLREAANTFNSSRDLGVYKAMTDEQLELVEWQQKAEIKVDEQLSGKPLNATLFDLMVMSVNMPSDARTFEDQINKMAKRFKVPEKALWYMKVEAFARSDGWGQLRALANEKRSPIGYKPFAMACIQHNQPQAEIEHYIDKITAPEEKFDLYVQIESWAKAADTAARMRDPQRLDECQLKCRDPNVLSDRLRHDGEWIAPQWRANRLRAFTGLWSCCGHHKRVSLFCSSVSDRENMQRQWLEKAENEENARAYKEFSVARRAMVEEQMQREIASMNSTVETSDAGATVVHPSANACMVLLLVHKCMGDEFLVQKSVEELQKQARNGDGRAQLMQHDCRFTLLTVITAYPGNPLIVRAIASSLDDLLGDGACKSLLDAEAGEATPLVMKLMEAVLGHQSSSDVLVLSFNAIIKAVADRVENAVAAVEASLLEYALAVCQIHKRDVGVLTAALRLVFELCNRAPAASNAVLRSVNAGVMGLGLHVVKRHRDNTSLLCAAVEVLQLLVNQHSPAAAEYLLRKNLISQLLELEKTIHTLPDNEKLHVHALQLTKQLSLHPKGAAQIERHRGGWQALGAFTSAGDELLHLVDGHMHNPGWTIGETQYLPRRQRQKYGREDPMPSMDFAEHWTVSSLTQFMGRSMKPISLPEEVDSNRFFFELIKLLGLLPHKSEDKEDWFKRVKAYEHTNNVVLDEVIEAVRQVHHMAGESSSIRAAERLAAAAETSDEAIEFHLISSMRQHRGHASRSRDKRAS